MKTRFKLLAVIAYLCAGSSLQAQSGTTIVVQDLETWTSACLSYKFNKKIKLSLTEQLRLKDNSTNVNNYFTQLGLSYKVGKNFKLGVAGRFIRDNDDQGKIQGYENHFRWNLDLSYRHDWERFNFKYRLRYQNRNELGITTDEQKNTYRIKVGTGYNIKNWKFDPRFAAELFNEFSQDQNFNSMRLTLGTNYKTKNIGDFGLYFRTENEFVVENPKRTNIIYLKYEYTIKRKKK